MGIAIVNSVKFRVLVIVSMACWGTQTRLLADDAPAVVPLDVAVVAEKIEDVVIPSPQFTFDGPHRVVDAGYVAVEDLILMPTGAEPGREILTIGHEAAPAVETHVQSKGTSSDKVKKSALAELPLNKLGPQQLGRVQGLLSEVGYFRRLPTTVFAVEPEVYAFFMRHPDVAVSIWRVMGISEMKMWQTGPNEYEGDSGDGSTGTIDVLFRSTELNLLLCEGQYQSPIMKKPIKARSLIMLKASFHKEADGTSFVTHRADMYVTFPSQTIETAAKILSPLTGPMADRTFTEMSLFIRMMSLAMTRRPAWVDQIAGQMEGVAEVRKLQLRQVMVAVHNDERKRQGLPPLISKATLPPARLPAGASEGALPVYGPLPQKSSSSNGTKSLQTKTVSSNSENFLEQFNDRGSNVDNPDAEFESSGSSPVVERKSEPRYRVEPGYQVIPKRQKP